MSEQTATRFRKLLARSQPSAFLLAAQLLLLVLYAVFENTASGRALISALGGIILIIVVWTVIRSPAANWVAWVLAIPALILTVLSAIFDQASLLGWSSVLEGLLYFYGAGSLIVYMMGDDQVTPDELFAAGATFTLFAWGYAHFYLATQAWLPGSFAGTAGSGQEMTFLQLLFVSFTNLSATGLSDIVPASAPARVLAMLEQFTGVGYVAMVVSRLVALTIQKRGRKQG